MQLASVAQPSLKYIIRQRKLNNSIIETVGRSKNGINSKKVWDSLAKETGETLPRALILSRLEFLVSMGRITYSNRKTGKGEIREYRIT